MGGLVAMAYILDELDDYEAAKAEERTCEGCSVPERNYGHAPYPCFDCCRNDARPDRYEPKEVE